MGENPDIEMEERFKDMNLLSSSSQIADEQLSDEQLQIMIER